MSTMTFQELIRAADARLAAAERRREAAVNRVRVVRDQAARTGRDELTPAEVAEFERGKRDYDAAAAEAEAARHQRDDLRRIEAEEATVTDQLSTRDPNATNVARRPAYDRVARVGAEERTYHEGNDRSGAQFIADVARANLYGMGAPDSMERLSRHAREEQVERGAYLQRAAGTGAFAGLTVPQYLTEMYAPAVAARRPFADVMTKLPLPSQGMTVNISRITTATSVTLQASENTAVSNTDIDDTILTENVQTAAGQQTLSRQAVERGTGVEDVTVGDLLAQYASTVDSTIINQATTGLLAVAGAGNTYVDASPTGAELYPKILACASTIESTLLSRARGLVVVMHPRRWHWLSKEMTTSWPLISQPGIPTQAGGTNLAQTYGTGFRGLLPNGMPVVVDANLPTTLGGGTEDAVAVVPTSEAILWEDPNAPVFIRAEQPAAGSLGVLLVVYGYFAYTLRRYAGAHQKITGTGLIAPTF